MSRNAVRNTYALPKTPPRRPELARRRELLWIPSELLRPDPNQPRKEFDTQTLGELTETVREHGIEQPLLVRPPDLEQGLHVITDGERRYRAGVAAGLVEFPCFVVAADTREAYLQAVIANVQRDALTPVDAANAVLHLRRAFELETDDEVAALLKKSRDWVRQMNALALLDDETKETLRERREPIAIAMHLRPQKPDQRRRTLEAVSELGLESRDDKVAFITSVNERLRAGATIEDATTPLPPGGWSRTPASNAGSLADDEMVEATRRPRVGRPRRFTQPFTWHDLGGGLASLEVHPRGLPLLVQMAGKSGVSCEEFLAAIREALGALRDTCADHPDGGEVWSQAEAAVATLFERPDHEDGEQRIGAAG